MSRFYIIDIETIPLAEEELVALMPPAMANPVMPEEVKNPLMPEEFAPFDVEDALKFPPDFMEGCPAYKTKAHPDGDPEKKKAFADKAEKSWREGIQGKKDKTDAKRVEWTQKAEDKRMAWEENAIENKQRFIDDAALSAVTGSVKLIGLRDYVEKKTYIFMAGVTAEEMELLNEATYPCKVVFLTWAEEKEMLSAFTAGINHGNVVPANEDSQSDFRLIGFYTHGFDFPFVFRRAWITGAKAPHMLRKGRYFNDAFSTDILEAWQLGDRQVKTGGMDGVAKVLKTKRKSAGGEGFHRLWTESPVAAVLYLIDDLDVAEEIAERMGVVYAPKPSSVLPLKGK